MDPAADALFTVPGAEARQQLDLHAVERIEVGLGLDAEQTASALGAAGSCSSGVIEFITGPVGAETFRIHPGKSAHDGILATLFAQQRLTSPHSIIEGRDGFLHAFSDVDWYAKELQVSGLGRGFIIMDVAVMYHNSTHAIASAVGALQSIAQRDSTVHDADRSIETFVPTMHACVGGDSRATLNEPPKYGKAQWGLRSDLPLQWFTARSSSTSARRQASATP